MKINLTKKQYETLVKLVYMGVYMVEVSSDPEENEYTEMEEYISSLAKNFNLEHLVEYYEDEKRYYPSLEIEDDEEIVGFIQNYNDDIFWEKLIYSLARCDFINEYREDKIEKMTDEESFVKFQPFVHKYEKEFSKNGLKNIKI